MATVSEVARPQLNRHDELRWWVGTILAIDTVNHELTVSFVGDTSTGTPYVDYIDGYTPVIGAKVHAISNENRGMLVIGSTGMATVVVNPPPPPPPPAPDARAVAAGTGTYIRIPNGPSGFNQTLVAQGDGLLGVWNMPDLGQAIQDASALGLIVRAEIEITLLHGGPRAILTLVRAVDPIAMGFVRRVGGLVSGVPTRVALPLDWLNYLKDGSFLLGLVSGSMVPPVGFEVAAAVYLTVEAVGSV